MEIMTKKEVSGFDYFKLVLLSLLGLGLEVLLVIIEPIIYGQPVDPYNWTIISHWTITYFLWLGAVFFILKLANTRYGFNLNEGSAKPKLWQYGCILILIVLFLILSFINWGGFKLQKEFVNLGVLKFVMQYIYYAIETMLFTLIIVFGQKAFEKWFKNDNVPYGGIVCALTWGLAHIFTKSSLEVGILSAIVGFGFGSVYLLLNRNIIKTFPIIFLMFVL